MQFLSSVYMAYSSRHLFYVPLSSRNVAVVIGKTFFFFNERRPYHSHYGGWCGNPRPHLRLVYEANPLAFVAAACGGHGSDGGASILTTPPEALHQRTSVFLGSVEDVAELESYGDVRQGAAEYTV